MSVYTYIIRTMFINNLFYRNHAEITKRMMEKIQEQTEIVEASIFIQIKQNRY